MKKPLIALLMLAFIGGSVVAGRFIYSMNQAFEFAQNQARTGRAYMDSMQEKDFEEALKLASDLMKEPEPEWDWHTLSPHDKRNVPQEWQDRGVIFIRYRPDSVSFGWHGGPHAHTHLNVDRSDNGSFTFTAYYTDHEPNRLLRTFTKAEADASGSDKLPN